MRSLVLLVLVAGCGASPRTGTSEAGHDLAGLFTTGDAAQATAGDGATLTSQDGGLGTSYTVYAHADHVLYSIDLATKTLVEVGPFSAPNTKSGSEDVITDLAVAPDNTIYVISSTTLYTASATDGHVTVVGTVSACGSDTVALTTTPDGNLYAGDYKGAFCKIDLSTTPPSVTQIGSLGMGLALSGDLVAIEDGTMYGSAYTIADTATAKDNSLVVIDTSTGAVSMAIGPTGYPQLYGVAYAAGQVFGFTHDGSGDVITIDPKTGIGTLFNTFKSGGAGIAFAGAGVNSMVPATIN